MLARVTLPTQGPSHVPCGCAVLYCVCGCVAVWLWLWCCVAVVLWCCGAVVLWCCGAVVLWLVAVCGCGCSCGNAEGSEARLRDRCDAAEIRVPANAGVQPDHRHRVRQRRRQGHRATRRRVAGPVVVLPKCRPRHAGLRACGSSHTDDAQVPPVWRLLQPPGQPKLQAARRTELQLPPTRAPNRYVGCEDSVGKRGGLAAANAWWPRKQVLHMATHFGRAVAPSATRTRNTTPSPQATRERTSTTTPACGCGVAAKVRVACAASQFWR